MNPPPNEVAAEIAWLVHALAAAQAVVDFVDGRTWADYQRDELLRSAVERKVEIIGEASRNLSKVFKSKHPHVPWRPIEAQRHRLIHEFYQVKPEVIWNVATVHVPILIDQLRALLATLSTELTDTEGGGS